MSAFHKRLDDFFAAYAPEKRPMVASLVEKYAGREEEIIEGLVKKFGPEPKPPLAAGGDRRSSVQSTASAPADHRERLTRFYAKYAPQKLSTVDATLEKFSGREEELFISLVKRYGPCPSCSDNMSVSSENASDTQSLFSGSVSSRSSRSYQVDDVRWRLTRLFMQYAPEKIPIVDEMLETYFGKEEEMMARFVEQLGAEPPLPNVQPPRERLLRYFEHYMPKKLSKLEDLLKKYGDHIESLFGMLVYKFGAEPPAPFYINGVLQLTFRQRLIRFYKTYERDKLANIDSVLRRYKGNEEEMFRVLTQRYGPEPDPDVDPDAPLPPEKDYRARLTRFFSIYAPERLDTVSSLLEKYKGREEDIIETLKKKLGPEPPFDPPVVQSRSQTEEHSREAATTVCDTSSAAEPAEDMSTVRSCSNLESAKDGENDVEAFLGGLHLPLSVYRKYAASMLGEERVGLLEQKFGIPCKKLSGGNIEQRSQRELVPATTTTSAPSSPLALTEGTTAVDRKTESSLEWNSAAEENISANFSCLLLILESVNFPLAESCNEDLVFQRYPLCTILSERDRFTLQTAIALNVLFFEFNKSTEEILSRESAARQSLSQSLNARTRRRDEREEKEYYTMCLLNRALDILPELENKERQEWESVERIEMKTKATWFQQTLDIITQEDFELSNTRCKRPVQQRKSLDATSNSPTFQRTTMRSFASPSPSSLRRRSYMDPLLRHQPVMEYCSELNEDTAFTKKHRILPSDFNNTVHFNESGSPLPTNAASPNSRPCRVMKLRNSQASDCSPAPLASHVMSSTISREWSNENRSGRDQWGPGIDGRLSAVAPPLPKDAREAIMLGEPLPAGMERDSFLEFRNIPIFFNREK